MTNTDWIKLKVLFPYVSSECKISNEKHIKDVIWNTAYKDMTPRTLPGIGTVKNPEGEILKDVMLKYVTDRFIEYFKHPAPKDVNIFDKWHKDTCDEMIKVFDNSSVIFSYGKAQKLVNIAFKNFLLFSGAKEEYFTYCHTPIDNNVLKWCKNTSVIKCRKDGWSKMDYDEYIKLQRDIREYLNDSKKYLYDDGTPVSNLVIDFYAWIEGGYKDELKKYWEDVSIDSKFYFENEETIKSIINNMN